MTQRRFELEDVLSVTSGVMLTTGARLHAILSWLIDDPALPGGWSMVAVGPRCTAMLLEQFPALVGVLPPEDADADGREQWLDRQRARFGYGLVVTRPDRG